MLRRNASALRTDLDMGITPSRRIPPLDAKAKQRFWSKVRKTDGCWFWEGPLRAPNRYGHFSVTFDTPYGRAAGGFAAHRIAYYLANGDTPLDILHSCDEPQCVRPEHLRKGTASDNAQDKVLRGRCRSGKVTPVFKVVNLGRPRTTTLYHGENHHFAKLTDAEVRAMRERYAASPMMTAAALAREFPVTKGQAIKLLTGLSRRQAGGPIAEYIRPSVGQRHPNAKLVPEQVLQLRAKYAEGLATMSALSVEFNIALQTVSNIIRGKIWKHVPVPSNLVIVPGHTKLTNEQAKAIRLRRLQGAMQLPLAKEYGVSLDTIQQVLKHRTHA